jgi:adenylate kinase family enzyme
LEVFALVGASGTGKSHRALVLAKDKQIEYIIDDGLLIQGNHVIAVKSAKRETSKIAAIRRALFTEDSHSSEVKEKIKEVSPEKILILGTSMGMIYNIAKRLEIPRPGHITDIKDIASEVEIRSAQRVRKIEGKHVIPVPAFEIKKDFSGYILDPLKIFSKKGKDFNQPIAEKSVVRPTFSYMGKYFISESAVEGIASQSAKNCKEINRVIRVHVTNIETGVILHLEIVSHLTGVLVEELARVQRKIKDDVEHMTALNVLAVNISAVKLFTGNL